MKYHIDMIGIGIVGALLALVPLELEGAVAVLDAFPPAANALSIALVSAYSSIKVARIRAEVNKNSTTCGLPRILAGCHTIGGADLHSVSYSFPGWGAICFIGCRVWARNDAQFLIDFLWKHSYDQVHVGPPVGSEFACDRSASLINHS